MTEKIDKDKTINNIKKYLRNQICEKIREVSVQNIENREKMYKVGGLLLALDIIKEENYIFEGLLEEAKEEDE